MDERRGTDISPPRRGGAGLRLTIQWPHVQWRFYEISEDQLVSLENGANSVSLGLLGLFAGVGFSALTTLMTVDLTDRTVGVFWGFCVASFGLSLWFAYQSWRDRTTMRHLTERIREQHIQ